MTNSPIGKHDDENNRTPSRGVRRIRQPDPAALKEELRPVSEAHDAAAATMEWEAVIPAIVKTELDQSNQVFRAVPMESPTIPVSTLWGRHSVRS